MVVIGLNGFGVEFNNSKLSEKYFFESVVDKNEQDSLSYTALGSKLDASGSRHPYIDSNNSGIKICVKSL